MSKCSVWLEMAGDRVLVDLGSRAEGHWRGLGYAELGQVASAPGPEEPLVVERPARKTRAKKVVVEA